MKYRTTLLFLFIGMGGVAAQDFTTITKPHKAKHIGVNIPKDVEQVILPEKEYPDTKETFTRIVKPIVLSRLPLETMTVTSPYGFRTDPFTNTTQFHKGIDLKTDRSHVYSILHGEVAQADFDAVLGNYVKIRHGKYTVIYGHLSSLAVKKGDKVRAGSVLGISGSTGKSMGDHLHLTIKKGNEYVHPLLFLKAISIAKTTEDLLTLLSE